MKVHDGHNMVTIMIASASTSGPSPIRVWQWTPPVNDKRPSDKHSTWTLGRVIEAMLKVVVVIAAAAHIIHVIREQVQYELWYWCNTQQDAD